MFGTKHSFHLFPTDSAPPPSHQVLPEAASAPLWRQFSSHLIRVLFLVSTCQKFSVVHSFRPFLWELFEALLSSHFKSDIQTRARR